jgi:hypothetical protein
MSNTAAEILGALRSNIVALSELETPIDNDPYVADAKGFAAQAAVCVEKHMLASGLEVPPDPNKPVMEELPPMMEVEEPEELTMPPAGNAPAEETRRDRDKTARPPRRV